jgi:hypothetical protein
MPIPPLGRLLFAQGGLCFFCGNPLRKEDATVEHLNAKAHGGTNTEKNCVACCSEVNSLLGSMSLKEKIRVILNQKGNFVCPNKSLADAKPPAKITPPPTPVHANHYSLVVANLEKKGLSRPKKIEALKNTIRSVVAGAKGSLTESQLDALLKQLQRSGKVQISGTTVSYTIKDCCCGAGFDLSGPAAGDDAGRALEPVRKPKKARG